jgi:hypothetical protein
LSGFETRGEATGPMAKRRQLKSDMGWSTADRIVVRGRD